MGFKISNLSASVRKLLREQGQIPASEPRRIELEECFVELLARGMGIAAGTYEQEYRFHPSRAWRFDFAWPDVRLAVEIEGGVFIAGGHQRPRRFIGDVDKYNRAALAGWRVLRFTSAHLKKRPGYVMDLIHEALRVKDTTKKGRMDVAEIES